MTPHVPVFVYAVLSGLLGAALASFLCVAAERVPRGEGLGGRSHCACGRKLSELANIPVLSWLVLRGRAKCCGAKIPAFYVLAEASAAIWCFASVFFLGWRWGELAGAVFLAFLLMVGVRRNGHSGQVPRE